MAGPLVAIIGRPNVGKSTLFNRLLGQSLAIVSDIPGTTRDRISAAVSWGDRTFVLVDTGGLEAAPTSDLWELVRFQVETAMEEADAIVFLVDTLQFKVVFVGNIPDNLFQYIFQRDKALQIAIFIHHQTNGEHEREQCKDIDTKSKEINQRTHTN